MQYERVIKALAAELPDHAVPSAITSGIDVSKARVAAVAQALKWVHCCDCPDAEIWYSVPSFKNVCTDHNGIAAGQVVARVPPLLTLQSSDNADDVDHLVLTAWVMVEAPPAFVEAFGCAVSAMLSDDIVLTLFSQLAHPMHNAVLRVTILGRLRALADIYPATDENHCATTDHGDILLHRRLQLLLYVLRYRTRCPALYVPPWDAPPTTWTIPVPALVALPHTQASTGAVLVPLFTTMSCGVSPHAGGNTTMGPCPQCVAAPWVLATQRPVAYGQHFSIALAHPLPPAGDVTPAHLLMLPAVETGDDKHVVRCDGRICQRGSIEAAPHLLHTYPLNTRATKYHQFAVLVTQQFYRGKTLTVIGDHDDHDDKITTLSVMMLMCLNVATLNALALLKRDDDNGDPAPLSTTMRYATMALTNCADPLRRAETAYALRCTHSSLAPAYHATSTSLMLGAAKQMMIGVHDLEEMLAREWEFIRKHGVTPAAKVTPL
jgi:hypothetical protein